MDVLQLIWEIRPDPGFNWNIWITFLSRWHFLLMNYCNYLFISWLQRQFGCLRWNYGINEQVHPKVLGRCNYTSLSQYSWWRHQMEPFSALLALCAGNSPVPVNSPHKGQWGNSPVPVNSPHKGQWRRALIFSLICAWINDWVNNREAGDLRRHRGHYDVIVMCCGFS